MTTGYIYLFITLYAVALGEKYLYRFVIINYENCTSSDHLLDSLKALDVHLSSEIITRIESLFADEKIRGGKLRKITYIDGRVAKME